MDFKPIYFKEKLILINSRSDVGIVSLWSPPVVIRKHLDDAGIDLNDCTSRIAVIGTLYGEGLPEMLRNLMYNPQIHYLVLFGVDLDASRDSLKGFFERGLESTVCLGMPTHQIAGTHQKIDGTIKPEHFQGRVTLIDLGKPTDSGIGTRVRDCFNTLPSQRQTREERRRVPFPKIEVTRFPSNPQGHTIVADTPLNGWRELVHTLHRFGYRSELKKGLRLELQNVKVVITQPQEESDQALKEHGFSLEKFTTYQERILSAELQQDQHYGYGNRLRGYFKGGADEGDAGDTLLKVVEMLTKDNESRHTYISLWDTARDLLSDEPGHPCLVSLNFRKFDGLLTMTAIFRTHNVLKAWLENVYGLIAIQRFVADRTGMTLGVLTVLSHSISIAPQGIGLEQVKAVNRFRKHWLTEGSVFKSDPHGDFLISVDTNLMKIIVDHRFEGQRLYRYLGDSAEELEQQIAADKAISDVSHALYLGREIGRAEAKLNKLKRRK